MDTVKKRSKKILSIFLSLLLVVGTFCFFNPFEAVDANAATAGSYEFRYVVNTTNDVDIGDNKDLEFTFEYYSNNGTGSSATTTKTASYKWAENTGTNTLSVGKLNGFVKKVTCHAVLAWTAIIARKWEGTFTLQVKKSDGSWVDVQSLSFSEKGTSGIGQTKKDIVMTVNQNLPAVSSVSIASGDVSVTVPKSSSGTATGSTKAATVYDQYGIEWYKEPDSYILVSNSSDTTAAKNVTGVSVAGTSGNNNGTVTVTNAAKDWVTGGGSTFSKTLYIRAKSGSVYSNAIKLTVTNYKVNGSFYNYSDSANDWVSESSNDVYYNHTVTSPEVSRAGWIFKGWNTDKTASSGDEKIDQSIQSDTIWYAVYSKTLTGRFHYLNENGEEAIYNSAAEIKTAEKSAAVTAPSAPTEITVNGKTFTFAGWRTDSTAAAPNTDTLTVDADANDDTVKDFYAVYSREIGLHFDGNGGTVSGADKTETQYLNVNGDATNVTLDISGVTASAADAEFTGWAETSDASAPLASGSSFTLTDSKTVYAVYTCTVRFMNGSEVFDEQTVTRGHAATDPSLTGQPAKASDNENEYYFTGWDAAFDSVTSNMTVNAEFTSVAHEWTLVSSTAPGCTTEGSETYECAHVRSDSGEKCGLTKTVVLGAAGHKESAAVTENAIAATCTTDGSHDEVVYCSVCNAELSRNTVTDKALGHDLTHHDAKAATCTEIGWNAYDTCSRCDYTTYEEIAATGHKESAAVIENTVAATCTTDGSHDEVVYCSVCNTELSRNTVTDKALGHDLTHHDAKAATCTEIGWNAYDTCSRCDYTTYEEIAATGHKESAAVTENKVEPTCTTDGSHDEVVYCSVCNAELSRNTVTDKALGHAWGEWSHVEGTKTHTRVCANDASHVETADCEFTAAVTDPTCIYGGFTTYTCSVCGYSYTDDETAAKGHTYGDWQSNNDGTHTKYCTVCPDGTDGHSVTEDCTYTSEVTKAASCTTDGVRTYTCTECGYSYDETIPAYGHAMTETAAKDATCTEDGNIAYYTCGNCHKLFKDADGNDEITAADTVVKANGHTAGEPVKENEKAATCTADGSYDEVVYCTVCNKELSRETKTNGKIAHTPGEVQIENIVLSTCAKNGSHDEVVYCTVCGEELSRNTIIDGLKDHTRGETVTENKVEPTCTADGSHDEVVYCTVCNAELSRNTVTDKALGHDLTHHDAKAATCTEIGWNEYDTCSRCDYTTYEELPVDENAHAWGEWKTVKDATCGADGTMQRVCGNDGSHVQTEAIPATGNHTEVTDAAVAATCTTPGKTEGKHCSVCGMVLVAQEETAIDPDAHKYGEWIIDGTATCTTGGTKHRVCEYNGEHIETVEIPATGTHTPGNAKEENRTEATCTAEGGYDLVVRCTVCNTVLSTEHKTTDKLDHTPETVPGKAPTCTESGLTDGTKCSVCGEILKHQELIPANGHKAGETVIENRVEPTCTEKGSYDEVVYCTVCETELSRTTVTLDPNGHAPAAATRENYVDATCTSVGGYDTVIRCSVCDTVLSNEHTELPMTAHTPGDAKEENRTEATCTAEGGYDLVVRCTVCNTVLSSEHKTIDKLDHTPETVPGKAPACTESGLTDGTKCSVCGEILKHQEIIPALGHKEVTDEAKAATCTENGFKSYKCTRCDATKTDVIKATGHSFGEWVTVKEPTETEKGLAKRTCLKCDATEEKELPAKGGETQLRYIKFVNIDRMHYVLDDNGEEYTIYASSMITYPANMDLHFTVYTYSNFKYDTVIVKINGVKIDADENGVYTVPAGTDLAVVTVEGAMKDDDGTKVSFWEMIIRFFKKIIAAIGNLFGSGSGSDGSNS